MPTLHESSATRELADLRGWYLDDLRPKLTRAADAGAVEAVAAADFDRRLRELLRLPDPGRGEAAA
jgi:hypothetical protein